MKTAVIVGAGHRAMGYAKFSQDRLKDKLKIVGVADPDELRRSKAAERFGIDKANCFCSAQELADRGRPIADAVINATMDEHHVSTSIPLLHAGYDILLEKPFAVNEEEVKALLAAVRQTGKKVIVCHVLRYAPFYAEIRKLVAAGVLGDIVSMHTSENVSYHHVSVAYVRGKWNQASMLLAKCCHDLDLITWFKHGIRPVRVASFGSLMQYVPSRAPESAGTRCVADCPIEESCFYSAKKHHIEQNLWGTYAWRDIEHLGEATEAEKLHSLRTDNPHGRCVWKSDNTCFDHQSVLIDFADGAVATHDMTGGTARGSRYIHIRGTLAEVEGTLEDDFFIIRRPKAEKGSEYSEEKISVSATDEHGLPVSHGGGDLNLMLDFINVMEGKSYSISTTDIMDSVHGHQIVFAADKAAREKRVIELEEL